MPAYDVAALRKRGFEIKVPFYGAEVPVTYDPIKVAAPGFRTEYEARRKELQAKAGDAITALSDALLALPLRDDFPARDILIASGFETLGEVPRNAKELQELDGVDGAMAQRIIRAINTDERIDAMEVDKARWKVHAELCVMLVKDWDLTEGSEPIPVEVEAFMDGRLPPELALSIIEEIWRSVDSLGNPTPSNGTRPLSRRA